MSDATYNATSLRERFAGKWQIPAALISALLLAAVALNVKSPDRQLTVEQHLERAVRLIDQGLFLQARQICDRVLTWPEITDHQRGLLKLKIARASYGQAQRNFDNSDAGARRLIKAYEAATEFGAELTGVDHRRLAQLHERIDELVAALREYENARVKTLPPALSDRRRIIELSEYPLNKSSEQIASMLDAFIEDAGDSIDDLSWALGRRLEMLSTDEGWRAANELIQRFAPKFENTAYAPEFDYLTALALWGSKRYDKAERLLRDLMGRITVSDPVYSKAGWLLGRVVMFDGKPQRPQEAAAIFQDVISTHADRYYTTASWVGMAEALAYLRRHDEALKAYRTAIDDIASMRGHRLVNPDTIRASLSVISNERRHADDLETALDYLRLAMELVSPDDHDVRGQYLDRLGDLSAALGRSKIEESHRRRAEVDTVEADRLEKAGAHYLSESGEAYFELASLSTLNEARAARAMWAAAGMFDEAGLDERAIHVLRTYLAERPGSDVIPHLLLRLGQTLKRVGRCDEAVEVFQRAFSEYPRSIHANAALVPMAECYMAMGPEHAAKAEQALLAITENSEIYTPAAPEYRDALLALGEHYSNQERYEDAIVILDEFVTNHGDDARMTSALFLTAEAYRKSAMAIKEELLDPSFAGDAGRMATERIRRLRLAEQLYAAMRDRTDVESAADWTPLQRVYAREALLNQAWTLFELGRYADALKLYERATWVYKDSPAGLGAYMQAINCHIFLGNHREAILALRRATHMVETIDEEKFTQTEGLETRADWRRYFQWVGETLSADGGKDVAPGATS